MLDDMQSVEFCVSVIQRACLKTAQPLHSVRFCRFGRIQNPHKRQSLRLWAPGLASREVTLSPAMASTSCARCHDSVELPRRGYYPAKLGFAWARGSYCGGEKSLSVLREADNDEEEMTGLVN